MVRNRSKGVGSCPRTRLPLLALTVRLGGVVSLVNDKVFWTIIFAAGEVLVEDGLGAVGVSLQTTVSKIAFVEKKQSQHQLTFWASIEVPDI